MLLPNPFSNCCWNPMLTDDSTDGLKKSRPAGLRHPALRRGLVVAGVRRLLVHAEHASADGVRLDGNSVSTPRLRGEQVRVPQDAASRHRCSSRSSSDEWT